MLVEVLLQLLIGVINAQLLKAILLENLKPEYIEQPDELQFLASFRIHLFRNRFINPLDYPTEELTIDNLRDTVPTCKGFLLC